MTVTGLVNAKGRLKQKSVEYDELRKERAIAHDLSGDGWHDNPHFNRLQQLEADKSREVAMLRTVVDTARLVVIDTENRPVDAVRIGSLVQIEHQDSGNDARHAQTWEIVGYDESDPLLGLLAYNTPLGQALIGKEEGEEVEVELPTGHTRVLIVSLSPDSTQVVVEQKTNIGAR